MFVWVHTGEVNAKRTREKRSEAVLRQDIACLDNVAAGGVAARIQTDARCPLPLVLTTSVTLLKLAMAVTFQRIYQE
ncbi:hypothetical protein EST38_g10035 [Candolleomyces aberdarensis]|uniref:Uncharacterized protein n=1 Tax=Candolleomyces aberdarensis TaxID=2316362 RepID=A0A4Q2D8G4_9AGAR|nr:hypothetical protein EST38_g10035 [Candolleomyces aberdarensis]